MMDTDVWLSEATELTAGLEGWWFLLSTNPSHTPHSATSWLVFKCNFFSDRCRLCRATQDKNTSWKVNERAKGRWRMETSYSFSFPQGIVGIKPYCRLAVLKGALQERWGKYFQLGLLQ